MNNIVRIFLLIAFLYSGFLYAAQDSTVIVENAPIRSEPKKDSEILEQLAMGVEVRVSSYPVEGGWYKIRSSNGVYGWIHESHLSVNKLEIEDKSGKKMPKPERDRVWFLRGGAGLAFFRPEDLNNIFQFAEINSGFQFSSEFGRFVSPLVAVVFRFDALMKDLVAKDNVSNVSYNLAVRSYPMMLGADFHFIKLPAMRISIGIFGGVALATSFSTEAFSLNTPNIYVLESSPFTSLIRANLTRPLGRVLSIFAEVGYRYLRTEELITESALGVNGGSIYKPNGVFTNRIIDLSGFETSIGVGVHF